MLRSILLVCAGRSSAVENRLTTLGCQVTRATDGASALSLTRRQSFDAAVLISTGTEMDITETALNLRDISSLMPIFILVDKAAARRKGPSTAPVADLIPRTYALRIKDLSKYLAEPSLWGTPNKGSPRNLAR
jgi:hypothetical protein